MPHESGRNQAARPKARRARVRAAVAALLLASAVAGCLGGRDRSGDLQGDFAQAGSSTVLPIAEAWGEEFNALHPGVTFTVSAGGSGTGANKLCRGEIDVADMSRPLKPSERDVCARSGVDPVEFEVAIDGIAVVVSSTNTFVDHLTVDELHRIWTANASKQANRWSDLRPAWPDARITLFGPGTNSGTFDYFVEAILHPIDGPGTKGRSDFTPSEDDNVLVRGVRDDPHALAYFGLAYAEKNAPAVRAVPIDAGRGDGPVAPEAGHVESGKYAPLSRPLFMYTDGVPTGALKEYFAWGLSDEGQALVHEVGFIRLPAPVRAEMVGKLGGA